MLVLSKLKGNSQVIKLYEEWRDIKGYESLYRVSNLGNVKGLKHNKVLKPYVCKNGYVEVSLWRSNKKKSFRIHRLVAQAFIPNPKNKEEVNHIDGNKTNNAVSNLEWNTRIENVRHAYVTGLINSSRRKRAIEQYDLQGNYIKTFPSIREAATKVDLKHPSDISKVASGKGDHKTAGGFYWKYAS